MSDTRHCKNCYANLKDDVRADAVFCTPRCAAQWARDMGEYRTRTHAEKEETSRKPCEHCGAGFWYNEYAQRGGKRVPQYCSNKCRQAAYRARKGAAAGYTGHWDDARNDKTKGERTERQKQDEQDAKGYKSKKDTSQGAGQKKDTSRDKTGDKDTSQYAHFFSKDPYIVLGVTYLNSKAEIKKAYMKLIIEWHPDRNKLPEALRISQCINAAWDKLK